MRPFEVVALLAVLAAGVNAWPPGPWAGGAPVVYVSPTGSDWNSGRSPSSALRTLQRAADLARPGSLVRIQPGVYRERVHLRRGGVAGRPVVFAAALPGTVTITWACEPNVIREWLWRDEADGIYSTPTDWPIYRLAAGGRTLYRVPWGGVAALRKLAGRNYAQDAFWYEAGRLYVALSAGRHPADCDLATHLPVPEPREWGEWKSANLWIEAEWVELRDLRCEFGIGAGISIWNAAHVAIRDCAFSEATYGIKAGRGISPARNVSVERCLYHNYPQHDWLDGWLSWDEIYAAYPNSALICARDDGTRVRECLVTHCGDGLQLTSREQPSAQGILAEGNWLTYGTDDAIELDGPARQVAFRGNLVLDCFVSLGLSPVTQGPVLVEGNLFLHPRTDLNGAQFKLLSPSEGKTIRNAVVRDNVFCGNGLCWWNDTPVANLLVEGNVFAVQHAKDPIWPRGVTERSNAYWIEAGASGTCPNVAFGLGLAKGTGRFALDAVLFPHPARRDERRPPASALRDAFRAAVAEIRKSRPSDGLTVQAKEVCRSDESPQGWRAEDELEAEGEALTRADRAFDVLNHRPGPEWWDWRSHPATRPLATLAAACEDAP